MFSIEQSLFLRALGQAISHSLWQVAALWLVYAAISNIGKWSANRKYQLAAGASLAGFVWFMETFVSALLSLPPTRSISSVYVESNATDAGSSLPEYLLYLYHSTAVSFSSLLPYISCAYLLLFAVLSIRLTNGFRQVKLFSTQGLEKTNVEWRLFVQQHAAALGITKQVKIFTSQYVQSPLTLGFWKPIILLPIASLNHLTTAQVESILLHELAHIRRHDYLVNILLQVAEVGLFFNPFMRLLLKQVKQERENSCDDYVLQFQYSPKDYAKALLAVQHSSNTALLALAAKGNQSFQLLNRVKRMVAPQPKAFNYRQQLGLLLLFTILTLGFTVIIPHPKKAAIKIAKAAAKKSNVTRQDEHETVAVTEQNTSMSTLPPTPQPFNIVSQITDFANDYVNRKTLEVNTSIVEAKGAEIEAIGNEIGKEWEVKAKPFEAKMEAWGNKLGKRIEESINKNGTIDFSALNELNALSAEASNFVNDDKLKKLTSKLNDLVKAIPVDLDKLIQKSQMDAMEHWKKEIEQQHRNEEQEKATAELSYRQEAARAKQRDADKQRLLAEKDLALQKLAQLSADNDMSEAAINKRIKKLNLGLLTDDRDTTITGLKGLWAKVQRNHQFKNIHISQDIFVQPNIQFQNKKGKCVITIPENEITIDSDDEVEQPANFNFNGQNIDVRREKQIKNSKEEKVLVISFSASK